VCILGYPGKHGYYTSSKLVVTLWFENLMGSLTFFQEKERKHSSAIDRSNVSIRHDENEFYVYLEHP
jgi:hypothetical protein